MRYLLDTPVWLWSHEAHEKFGRKTEQILTSSEDERLVSAISTFEIARLIRQRTARFASVISELEGAIASSSESQQRLT